MTTAMTGVKEEGEESMVWSSMYHLAIRGGKTEIEIRGNGVVVRRENGDGVLVQGGTTGGIGIGIMSGGETGRDSSSQ